MLQRRHFTTATCTGLLGSLFGCASEAPVTATNSVSPKALMARSRCEAIEASTQGRLGVHILDTGTGRSFGFRDDDRFMLLSSFKLLASAYVLHRVDRGEEALNRRITFAKKDLVEWSPITEKHVGSAGMTLGQLCEATMTTSDNTAGNLLLASFGGPQGLTSYARSLGDTITRLDRNEPTLNHPSGDVLMDTTTPRAMARNLQKMLAGDALSPSSRELLRQWMMASVTGDKRLKAGVPADWKVGGKTGTSRNAANEVGVLLPPNGAAPVIVAAYVSESHADNATKEAAIAAVATLAKDLVTT